MEERDVVKEILSNLRGYLGDHLPVDVDFLLKLQSKHLLAKVNADKLRTTVETKGGKSGVDGLLDYMYSFYDEEMLEEFCVFLEEYSIPARRGLSKIAKRIREDLKQQQPPPTQPDDDVPGPSGTGPLPMESSTHHPSGTTRDNVPGPSGTGNISSETPTQKEELFYPFLSDELEDDFDDIALDTWKQINQLDEEKFESMRTFLAIFLKPKVPPDAEPPHIPKDKEKLKDFLISKWDMLNIRVLKKVIRQLDKHKPTCDQLLTKQMEVYEGKLTKEVPVFLEKCKIKRVPVKKIPCHSSLAVKIALTPSEYSLSRIFELKEFFVRVFNIPEALFKGFSTGSTILYFSIPDDSVWCLPACLHPSNLPQLEEWKVVSLSVEGKFTIDLVEKRIVDVLDQPSSKLMSEDYQFKDKIAEMEKALRYYEKVKPDPMSKVESLESEPLPKKAELEPPDYENFNPKLETADLNWKLGSDVHDRKEVTTNVLNRLHVYLQENLPVDVSFISRLRDKGLLADENADKLRTAVAMKGGESGVDGLLHYMSSYYDEEMLEKFCVFLEEYSQPVKPVLLTIATRIREEMKWPQPHPMGLTGSQQSDPSGPRDTGPLPMKSSTPHTTETTEDDAPVTSGTGPLPMESSTPTIYLHVSTGTSQDVPKPSGTGPLPMESSTPHPKTTRDDVPGPSGAVTEPFPSIPTAKSEPGDLLLFYPVVSDLEDDFSDLATKVLELIKTLEASKLAKLRTFLANLLKPKVPPSSPPPYVPEKYEELKSFLISRWDPLQIDVLQEIVGYLEMPDLSKQLKKYEKLLKKEIPSFLSECRIKQVPYKRLPHLSLLAVTMNSTPSELSLSRILELKEFFVRKLGLGEALFQGFSLGSITLYFSIPKYCVLPPDLSSCRPSSHGRMGGGFSIRGICVS